MIKSGTDLRHERQALGINQTQFAKLCNVARNTVIEWERRDKLHFITALGLDELIRQLHFSQGEQRGRSHEED